MNYSPSAAHFLPSEVLTDVLAFLPYKNASQFLYVSGRCSQILVKQINHQLQRMLDTCDALKASCSQLDVLINSLSVQLQPLRDQLYVVIVQGVDERYLAEIEAIWDRFGDQFHQLYQVSSPIENRIVQLKAEKAELNKKINKFEYFIQHGEFQPDSIPVPVLVVTDTSQFSLMKIVSLSISPLFYVVYHFYV
uniref:F-box domain-containing protein n=1 Tax=Ditylenchus dipsaci TaxID=166011 RepID=A0A915EPT4_9BILA